MIKSATCNILLPWPPRAVKPRPTVPGAQNPSRKRRLCAPARLSLILVVSPCDTTSFARRALRLSRGARPFPGLIITAPARPRRTPCPSPTGPSREPHYYVNYAHTSIFRRADDFYIQAVDIRNGLCYYGVANVWRKKPARGANLVPARWNRSKRPQQPECTTAPLPRQPGQRELYHSRRKTNGCSADVG